MILLGKILKICTITSIWIIPMWFKPGFSKLRHVAPPSLSGSSGDIYRPKHAHPPLRSCGCSAQQGQS